MFHYNNRHITRLHTQTATVRPFVMQLFLAVVTLGVVVALPPQQQLPPPAAAATGRAAAGVGPDISGSSAPAATAKMMADMTPARDCHAW